MGVVDERLVSQEFLIKPWASEWQAAKIADQFRKNGVDAEVIGADVLKDLSKLKSYHAVMIPTDQCYPDTLAKDSTLTRAGHQPSDLLGQCGELALKLG